MASMRFTKLYIVLRVSVTNMEHLFVFQTLIISQKISLKAEEEDGHLADSSCQDHMMGKIIMEKSPLLLI